MEEVIEAKVGSNKKLASIDLDCFDEITLHDLTTSAPGVVTSAKIIKQEGFLRKYSVSKSQVLI